MAGKVQIGYFLEDIGHENFFKALVERMAHEAGLSSADLIHDTRNARGGHGKVMTELREFLRDVSRGRDWVFDLLLIAIDANCSGYLDKRNEVDEIVNHYQYRGRVAYALPDPHIEYWYLLDLDALRQILVSPVSADLIPTYKCERNRYKSALRAIIEQTEVTPPLGGAEYGGDIAWLIDLYKVGKAATSFKHFIDDVRAAMSVFK